MKKKQKQRQRPRNYVALALLKRSSGDGRHKDRRRFLLERWQRRGVDDE
jgi:hypothetical protein